MEETIRNEVTEEERLVKEELLQDLGSAVRSLLEQQSSNPQIWGVYSGMAKILELIELVLKDGSSKMDYRGRVECRSFVLETSGESGVGMFGSCSIVGWVQLHLANQRLSIKLRELYSDKDRLKQFYRSGSISMDAVLRQTFLLIVEALEHQDIHRLDTLIKDESIESLESKQIDKKADVSTSSKESKDKATAHNKPSKTRTNDFKKTHRRSVSCPIIQEGNLTEQNPHGLGKDHPDGENKLLDKDTDKILNNLMKTEKRQDPNQNQGCIDKGQLLKVELSASSPLETKNELSKPLRGHRRGASDSGLRFCRSPEPRTITYKSDELHSSQEIKGTWSEVMPAKLGTYHKPKANQSLVSFLSETGIATSSRGRKAQLDRENAHFVLSEAMIGTLEHMSFDTSMRSIDEGEESDEEIRELKERMRLNHAALQQSQLNRSDDVPSLLKPRQKPRLRRPRKATERLKLLSDGRTDTATTDQSNSTDCNSDDNCLSGDELDKVLDSNDEEFSLFEPGSKDFLKDIPEGSAESIALSLLGQIGAGRLPPADQIPWLVTEQDAPQQLLPLPDSLPVDPDEDLKGATELRGNLVWAPPRPQLVLTKQEKPSNRKTMMCQQRWQCAGCALRVEERYSKSFRFCHYLGKFFCTGCHENQLAIIPARVIQDWDFKRYPVSNFSLEILKSVYTERLFNIMDLNPGMIRKVEKLKSVCKCRHQLGKINKYIINCKHSQDLIQKIESYVCQEPHLFSIQELFSTKFQKLGLTLRTIIGDGLKHVQSCQLCQARGYICEGCHNNDIIFPFQTGIYECGVCYSCYHKTCFNPEKDACSKCTRLQKRREKCKESLTDDD